MANDIWNRIGDFLNSLRCEDIYGKNHVRLKECLKAEAERREALEAYRKTLEELQFEKANAIEEYLDKVERSRFVGEKQAYCQGYVDCIQLLTGLGLLHGNPEIEKIIEKI